MISSLSKINAVVGKVVDKVASFLWIFVNKSFGFSENSVRLSTFGCSVGKFSKWISTFGSVRFTPVLGGFYSKFPQFPHSLLLLLFI